MSKIKSKNDEDEFEPSNDTQECPYEIILGIRTNNNSPTEYYVKLKKEPYYKSIWVSAQKLQKYQHSTVMLNRVNRSGTSSVPSEPPYYDPNYDIIDKIITREKNHYFVKWMNLEYEDCTWESKVDSSIINLYKKKQKEIFPTQNSDVLSEPSADFEPQTKYRVGDYDLNYHQLACLNVLIANYLDQKNSEVVDQLNMELHYSVAAFIQYSVETCTEPGPYLIITQPANVRKWYHSVRQIVRTTALEYAGSNESRQIIFENDFWDEGVLKFHIMVTSTDVLQQDINKIADIRWRALIFSDNQRIQSSKYLKLIQKIVYGHQISICNTTAVHFIPDLQRITDFFLSSKKNMKNEEDIASAEQLRALLTANTQKRAKQSIFEIQNDINPLYIDCPLNSLQKSVVRKVIIKNLEELRKKKCMIPCQLIYRIINHPFLIFKEESALNSPDFIQSSTKLQVISQLIDDSQLKNQKIIFVSHFSLMLDLIEDVVNYKKMQFSRVVNHSNDFENANATVFLYNPDFCNISPNAIEITETAVIVDGYPKSFMELLKENRSSKVETIYFLQCSECSETDLCTLCRSKVYSMIEDKETKSENICKYASLHAFSDAPIPDVTKLISSCTSEPFGENESSQIAAELCESDFWELLVDSIDENELNLYRNQEEQGNNITFNNYNQNDNDNNHDIDNNENNNKENDTDNNNIKSTANANSDTIDNNVTESEVISKEDSVLNSTDHQEKAENEHIINENEVNVDESQDMQVKEDTEIETNKESVNEVAKRHDWTVRERDQLIRNLFRFGWDRWKEVIEISGLNISESEIILASRAILREIIRASGSNTGHQLTRDFIRGNSTNEEEDIEEDKRFIESSCFKEPRFKQRIHKQGPSLLKRIESLHFIYYAQTVPQSSSSKRGFRGSVYPAEWWSDEHDAILIRGTIDYGFGCYEHYAEDPNYSRFTTVLGYDDEETIEQKSLNDRVLSLGEGLKRAKMKQDDLLENSSTSNSYSTNQNSNSSNTNTSTTTYERNFMIESKFSKEEFNTLTKYLLKKGIDVNSETGEKDYASLAVNCELSYKPTEDIKDYIDDLLLRCEMPPEESGLVPKIASNILARINGMNQLRTLFREIDEEVTRKFFESAPKWRGTPDTWTYEHDLKFFEEILKRGFGTMADILNDPFFANIFPNNQPPQFLTRNASVTKRIASLYEFKKKKKQQQHQQQAQQKSGKTKKSSHSSSHKDSSNANNSKDQFVPTITYEMLDKGDFEYPIQITATTELWSVGEVVYDRPGFHNQRYVYPAGYKASRFYTSANHPNTKVKWFCEILDTGEDLPCFRIWMEEQPNIIYSGQTPTAPWTQALKQIAKKSNQKPVSISGPEAFLLGTPIVVFLIQKLPNIDKLDSYKVRELPQLKKYMRDHPIIHETEFRNPDQKENNENETNANENNNENVANENDNENDNENEINNNDGT
ncbi:hypothetical protein TRFO_22797 [Tritrichomonas foetus]|uniref:Chromo domain-containing protein n=1 Tax=Tritrichomonas foetus TaxID=1144522 RepID=A0A1J4KBL0_9EUKA|nr:hypothetical protein TRFO_22797 [Tritrichomonas foetus]|eukprot:OHT08611.1 hypothetical protein TRFO_22797 [Tritrichomonas foetus]